jgi:hypothetical protein
VPRSISQLLLRNVRVLRGVLLLTPETCVVKSEPTDALFDEAWDEAAFDRSLRERLGCVVVFPHTACSESLTARALLTRLGEDAQEVPEERPPAEAAAAQNDEIDDYVPDDFDLPDALAPHPPRSAPRPAAVPVPAPSNVRPPSPPPELSAQRVSPGGTDDPFDDTDEWDEDALIAAAEAEAAEEQLQQMREYERPPPPPLPVTVERQTVLSARVPAPPPRASGSPTKRNTSQSQVGPSMTRRTPAIPRPERPASPAKPLFPPFTATSSKRPAGGSIFPSSSRSGPSTSSQKPTSQLEPVLITSSPESERPALPKTTAPRKKTLPAKRTAPAASASVSTATARRVKGRPRAEVEVIEID